MTATPTTVTEQASPSYHDDDFSVADDEHDLILVRRLANQALVDVFSSLDGHVWRNKNGWLTPGTDVRRWHGITVDAGKLVSLNLISNHLQGEIPRTISNLVTLRELNMSYNFGIVGVLPEEVGSMPNLTVLHLYSAGLHGPIPESLSQLRCLEELWLNGNRLSGSIPDGLGHLPHLRELYLNANELVGKIPPSFSELTNLEGLNVSWNQLSGGFPACLGKMVSLKVLVMEGNDGLEDTPPAEQGTELLEWLAAKRAASSDEGELVGRTDEPDLEPGVGSEDACQTEASGQAREGTPPGDVGDKVLREGHVRTENDREIVAPYSGSGPSPSLEEVLRDEAGRPYDFSSFRAFAASQLTEENVDFCLEVERVKECKSEAALRQVATAICSRFVAPGAPMELNLSGSIRALTMAKVQQLQSEEDASQTAGDVESRSLDRSIFDQAQRQIYELLNTDAYPRFTQAIHTAKKGLVDNHTAQPSTQET